MYLFERENSGQTANHDRKVARLGDRFVVKVNELKILKAERKDDSFGLARLKTDLGKTLHPPAREQIGRVLVCEGNDHD